MWHCESWAVKKCDEKHRSRRLNCCPRDVRSVSTGLNIIRSTFGCGRRLVYDVLLEQLVKKEVGQIWVAV